MRNRKMFLFIQSILVMLFLLVCTAMAASKPTFNSSNVIYASKYGEGEPWVASGIYQIRNFSKKAKVLSVKAGSKKVYATALTKDFTAWNGKWKGLLYVSAEGLEPGKSFAVTIKVRQGGKTYTLKPRFKIKKRQSPFESFRIDGVEYADKFVGTTVLWLPKKDFAGRKVKVSWKLMDFANNMDGKTIRFFGTTDAGISVKNGGSVRFTKKGAGALFLPLRFTNQEMEHAGSMPFKYEVYLQ